MNSAFKEGERYKTINVGGKTFEIKYGYYSEDERSSEFSEAIPIYPNFKENPVYSDEGMPIVTQMQDICEHYEGWSEGDDCFGCKHYRHGDDLMGICKCEKNRLK